MTTLQSVCPDFDLEGQDEVYIATHCHLGHYCFKPGCQVTVDAGDWAAAVRTSIVLTVCDESNSSVHKVQKDCAI